MASGGNTIGGAAPGTRNLVSGNGGFGISAGASEAILGNFIGTDVAGAVRVGNVKGGISGGGRIGGTSGTRPEGPCAGACNLISGNGGAGVAPAAGSTVAGNFIGTDAAGTVALPNGGAGVFVNGVANVTIGGASGSARNLISGNAGPGVEIAFDAEAANLTGNVIGADATGEAPLPNADGVRLRDRARKSRIGAGSTSEGNLIAFNAGAGVVAEVSAGDGNAILGNSIHSNGALGIDLGGDGVTPNHGAQADAGPNGLQNFPVLEIATPFSVEGTLDSTPHQTFTHRDLPQSRLRPFRVRAGPGPDRGDDPFDRRGRPRRVRRLADGTAGRVRHRHRNRCRRKHFGVLPLRPDCNGGRGGRRLRALTRPRAGNSVFPSHSGKVTSGPAAATEVLGMIRKRVEALLLAVLCALAAAGAHGATITVTSDADTHTDGQCTLREALTAANTNTASGATSGDCVAGDPGADTIAFAILPAGVHTIQPALELPAITEPLTIDGYTQPASGGGTARPNTLAAGSDALLLIELDGSGIDPKTFSGGLIKVAAGPTRITGLVINRAPGSDGVGVQLTAGGNTVAGNFIGTDPTGTLARGNGCNGVRVFSSGNTIGGASPAARNVIAATGGCAINLVLLGNDNRVQGNFIGTNAAGTGALGGIGVDVVGTGNLVGGTTAAQANLISGNGTGGVRIYGSGTTGNTVEGNLIGVGASGSGPLPNLYGIRLIEGAHGNAIGGDSAAAGNLIAFNTGIGVEIGADAGSDNSILSNAIFSNGGLGIDLGADGATANDAGDADDGPNGLQNFPVLTSVTSSSVEGTLESAPSTNFTLQFFANTSCDPTGFGEAQTPIGFAAVTTDAAGHASFGTSLTVPPGQALTATATDASGSTSELSPCVLLTPSALAVDGAAGGASDGNGVLEPGETVGVEPSWSNLTDSGRHRDRPGLRLHGARRAVLRPVHRRGQLQRHRAGDDRDLRRYFELLCRVRIVSGSAPGDALGLLVHGNPRRSHRPEALDAPRRRELLGRRARVPLLPEDRDRPPPRNHRRVHGDRILSLSKGSPRPDGDFPRAGDCAGWGQRPGDRHGRRHSLRLRAGRRVRFL